MVFNWLHDIIFGDDDEEKELSTVVKSFIEDEQRLPTYEDAWKRLPQRYDYLSVFRSDIRDADDVILYQWERDLATRPFLIDSETASREDKAACETCGRIFFGDDAGQKLGGHKIAHRGDS